MQPIIDALLEPALADSAASVIGVAAANNAKFQTDLLEVAPHIFDALTKVCLYNERYHYYWHVTIIRRNVSLHLHTLHLSASVKAQAVVC